MSSVRIKSEGGEVARLVRLRLSLQKLSNYRFLVTTEMHLY